MDREALLQEVASRLLDRRLDHPLRVGIDGPSGVGKTTFADELVTALRRAGRPAIRLDSDGFHHVRAVRYRQGRHSARGYYEDAYDLDSVRRLVLDPLGPGGSRRFATKVHDLRSDAVVLEEADAAPDAILVLDATFLQRGALRDAWDEVIYLDAPERIAQQRGVARDAAALGGTEAALAVYRARYTAAFRIYLDEEQPAERADVLIDHADPLQPTVLRWSRTPS